MTFEDLVSQAINNKAGAIEKRCCPDQFVGKISAFNSKETDFPTRMLPTERPEDLKCLIMVIESPHIDEFAKQPCPAKGKTGELIREWICNVKGLSSYQKEYGLIIINAIQYQCSLGSPTRCFRDEVFESVWSDFGEENFIKRLGSIYKNGDVILNCCTKGNSKNGQLRLKVQQAIKKLTIPYVLLRRTHPSSWHSKRNRKYEWSE